jgi:hypothetical protein
LVFCPLLRLWRGTERGRGPSGQARDLPSGATN